jgi:hypothetical protein
MSTETEEAPDYMGFLKKPLTSGTFGLIVAAFIVHHFTAIPLEPLLAGAGIYGGKEIGKHVGAGLARRGGTGGAAQ